MHVPDNMYMMATKDPFDFDTKSREGFRTAVQSQTVTG
jgi:hypothetical protein